MLVNVLLTVVSTVAYAFPLGVGCFLAARLLWGACYSHLRLGGYLVALGASPAGLGLALGLIQSFSRLGSMLAVLGGGLLADRWGYSWVMAGAGLFSLGALPFVGGCRGALGKAEIGSVDPLPQGGCCPINGPVVSAVLERGWVYHLSCGLGHGALQPVCRSASEGRNGD